jgi:hypothetical protein
MDNYKWDIADAGEIWKYRVEANSWTQVQPRVPIPGNRVAAYDPINHAQILFGGATHGNLLRNDTWAFDLLNRSWRNLNPPIAPPARDSHAMVFDSDNGVMVLFGGYNQTNVVLNDTWIYNVSTNIWAELHPTFSPAPRYHHGMAYDPVRKVVVMYGGEPISLYGHDTWTFDLSQNTWTKQNPVDHPSSRQGSFMSFDGRTGVVILHGGYSSIVETDIWAYDTGNNTWQKKEPLGSKPQGFYPGAYDSEKGISVFLGSNGVLWIYDSAWNLWTTKTPPRTLPPDRSGSILVYDAHFNALVLVGFWSDLWVHDMKQYMPDGKFTSRQYDIGGPACFGALSWNASNPAASGLAFQLRTANTSSELSSCPFVGPDGTERTSYTTSGKRIYPGHNNSRWVQYRADFSTTRVMEVSPALSEVTLEYNRPHSVDLTAPRGGERWCAIHDITWNSSDPDGDRLTIDLYLVEGPREIVLATDIPAEAGRLAWDTSSVLEGTYSIRIEANDKNPSIPLAFEGVSGAITIYRNFAPAVTLVEPQNNTVLETCNVNLTWNGTDANRDELRFRVFLCESEFDKDSLPLPVGTTNGTSWAATLGNGKDYYWSVMASDGFVDGSLPGVRKLSVRVPPPNRPPSAMPVAPLPDSVVKDPTVNLSWTGSDKDGDPLHYFVLLSNATIDIDAPPPPVAITNVTFFWAGDLANATVYQWAVVPNDGKVNGTILSIWSFRVDFGSGNHPPRIPGRPPTKATVGAPFIYDINATDEDGDALAYSLVLAPDGATLDSISGRLAWTPAEGQTGNQLFRVRASDWRGAATEQAFSVFVSGNGSALEMACIIKWPANKTVLKNTVQIRGTASRAMAELIRVQVRVDDGPWEDASGTQNWSFELDTARLSDGNHLISARAFDGTYFSDVATVRVVVSNGSPNNAGADRTMTLIAVAVAIAVGAVASIRLLRKKGKPGPG